MSGRIIFHITDAHSVSHAERTGVFVPEAYERDGFIHCSYAAQIVTVAEARFRGRRDLVLLEIDRSRVRCEVRDEDLGGEGRLYPHIYGPLALGAVVAVHPFPCGADGGFELPLAIAGSSRTLFFLPGASGDVSMWRPIADDLADHGRAELVTWPGFGGAPSDPAVRGMDDLVTRLAGALSGPADVLAQSMGGVIALRVALMKAALVRRLVLAVTSGGVDVTALGGEDWRPAFLARNPGVPRWFIDSREDFGEQLRAVSAPTLLLWGDADPISPVAVGRQLASLLPNAELVVVPGGTHDLVAERAADVLPHIRRHLGI
jgi:uncharacterized protein (DUF952 family)/alpha-beta hydrolase superfamily lysophospholipase